MYAGALSQSCYYRALEDVYEKLIRNVGKARGSSAGSKTFDAETPDYWVFHAPYNKLVQKSYGRLMFMDARRRNEEHGEKKDDSESQSPLTPWLAKPAEDTYDDKSLEKSLKILSANAFEQRFKDSNAASKMIGNTYTASVFFGLASLVDRAGRTGDLSPGKSIGLFSYG